MIQPFFIKKGKKILHRGRRNQLISKLVSGNGEKIVKNPRFGWIEEKEEKNAKSVVD